MSTYICYIPWIGSTGTLVFPPAARNPNGVSRTMDEAFAIDGLGSLAQSTRLTVFRRLLAAHPGSVAAGDLARLCDVPHNTMSTHLGVLSRAGLIVVERDGRAMNYRADLKA